MVPKQSSTEKKICGEGNIILLKMFSRCFFTNKKITFTSTALKLYDGYRQRDDLILLVTSDVIRHPHHDNSIDGKLFTQNVDIS